MSIVSIISVKNGNMDCIAETFSKYVFQIFSRLYVYHHGHGHLRLKQLIFRCHFIEAICHVYLLSVQN